MKVTKCKNCGCEIYDLGEGFKHKKHKVIEDIGTKKCYCGCTNPEPKVKK